MSIFRRKPKRFVAVNVNHGRYRYLIPWAVYLNEKDEYGYKRIPHDIKAAHPELRLDYIMGRGDAVAVARFLNRTYPLDTNSTQE